jgi:hypothetical protein
MGSGGSKDIDYVNDSKPPLQMNDKPPNQKSYTTIHEGFEIFRENKNKNDIIQIITIIIFLLLFMKFKYI